VWDDDLRQAGDATAVIFEVACNPTGSEYEWSSMSQPDESGGF
jgi:hypothetical protein